ncbi:MAG: acyl-CoA carboxylase subunit beta [Methyloligellaceae bacterium]
MQRMSSRVDVNDSEYKRNRAHNLALVEELHQRQNACRYDRPERDLQRIARQNKLFVRERIDCLLDPGSPFLEFSTLAANQAYDGEVPAASVVCGLGIVSGREVIVRADDSSIKGGAYYPLSVKKIVRTLDIAIENRLPIVHLCDSAGAFLPLQSGLFADKYFGGRSFRNQCVLSKLGIQQVSVVLGHCTAGGAYVPALSDYSIMVRGTGGIFLGGPPLVKAATGEVVTAEELGGADVHTQISGTADYAADSEEEAIAKARDIVSTFARTPKVEVDWDEPEDPYYDPDELHGILPIDGKTQYDVREVIARLVDGSRFQEFQPDYGTTLVCGYARVHGYKVGILGNNGVLFNDSSLKAAHFITHCNNSRTPLIFLQNITGYMVGKHYEELGITKDGAKMIMAQACADVPKFTVIVGGSYGAGNYGMCGRAYDARFLWTWPQSRISVMGADQAAGVLADLKVAQLGRQGQTISSQEVEAIRRPIQEKYETESNPYFATSELWDDGILDPVDTRNALGMGLAASLNAPIDEPRYGVLRL